MATIPSKQFINEGLPSKQFTTEELQSLIDLAKKAEEMLNGALIVLDLALRSIKIIRQTLESLSVHSYRMLRLQKYLLFKYIIYVLYCG